MAQAALTTYFFRIPDKPVHAQLVFLEALRIETKRFMRWIHSLTDSGAQEITHLRDAAVSRDRPELALEPREP